MQKLRSYISVLFLALLLFPMAEKAKHELSHLQEEHCDAKGIHYCAKEHTCHICDYIFASSVQPSPAVQLAPSFAKLINEYIPALSSAAVSSIYYNLSLRGPPGC